MSTDGPTLCTVTSVQVNDGLPDPHTREHLGVMPWADFHDVMRIVRAVQNGGVWDAPSDDGVAIRYCPVDEPAPAN